MFLVLLIMITIVSIPLAVYCNRCIKMAFKKIEKENDYRKLMEENYV